MQPEDRALIEAVETISKDNSVRTVSEVAYELARGMQMDVIIALAGRFIAQEATKVIVAERDSGREEQAEKTRTPPTPRPEPKTIARHPRVDDIERTHLDMGRGR